MKSLFATLLVSAALAAPAYAQSLDLNTIIANIGSRDFLAAAELSDGAGSVRVERLSSFAGAGQAADRLDRVRDVHVENINYLHFNLATNVIAMRAIRNAGVSLDDIVSVYDAGGNGVILYADDL